MVEGVSTSRNGCRAVMLAPVILNARQRVLYTLRLKAIALNVPRTARDCAAPRGHARASTASRTGRRPQDLRLRRSRALLLLREGP